MKTADLNPPLGSPGGPCYVVDRIEERMRPSPRREDMIHQVETGESLSNVDAAQVYPLERDKGAPGTAFAFLKINSHAQYRMDQRGITLDDVRQTLKRFQEFLVSKDPEAREYSEKLAYGEKLEITDPRTRLKIVFTYEAGTVNLITLFWRGKQDPKSPGPGQCTLPDARRVLSFAGDAFSPNISDAPNPEAFRTDTNRDPKNITPPGGVVMPGMSYTTPGGPGVQNRTLSEPAPARNPVKLDYGTPRRRASATRVLKLASTEDADDSEPGQGIEKEAWTRKWKPGVRQRRQRGRDKQKSRQYYRKNRSKLLRQQRLRRSKPGWKRNPQRMRSERMRRKQNRRRLADYAPPRERGGVDGRRQRHQPRSEQYEDQQYYKKHKSEIKRKNKRRYKQVCRHTPACKRRREEYREDPQHYERGRPSSIVASVLTAPDIAFAYGPEMVLGYVHSLSPMTGLVTVSIEGIPLISMSVPLFLAACTLLTDEDADAFFDLVDVELGEEAYEDLSKEEALNCVELYGVAPESEAYQALCLLDEDDFAWSELAEDAIARYMGDTPDALKVRDLYYGEVG